MRRGFLFPICLLGFLPFSNLRAQEGPAPRGADRKAREQLVYTFPREIQAVLADAQFILDVEEYGGYAANMGRELEIRHVQVNVGARQTTVDVTLMTIVPEGSSIEGEPRRIPFGVLSYPVEVRANGTIQVLNPSRHRLLLHFSAAQEAFPKELSALLVDPAYAEFVTELRSKLRGGRSGPISEEIVVLQAGIHHGWEVNFEFARVTTNDVRVVLPYGSIVARVEQVGFHHFSRATNVETIPVPSTNVASVREAEPPLLPESPKAEPANRVSQTDAKTADVDIVKETEKSVREGKARREGKGREGRK